MSAGVRVIAISFCICVGLLAGSIRAQAPLPPVEDQKAEARHKRTEAERLSREARELGREYLELLHELQEVMADYNRYLSKAQVAQTTQQRKELETLMKKLQQGAYLRDMTALETDLAATQEELMAQEAALKALKGDDDRKVYALTRNLQRSLEAINIQLESELGDRFEGEEELRRELRVLFQEAAEGGQTDPEKLREVYIGLIDDSGHLRVVIPEFDFDFSLDLQELEELEQFGDWFDSSAVVVPSPPSSVWSTSVTAPPAPGQPPHIVIGGRNIIFTGNTGETQVVKEFSDSLQVGRDRSIITVSNPNGDLRLTGWDRQVILVRSEIGVSASTPAVAERLAEKVRLQLRKEGTGYAVGYTMPSLSDPQQQVSSTFLEVMVPRGNPVNVTSSFGDITVTGLQNSLTVAANHAPLEVADVVGAVAVTAMMAPVEISDVQGAVSVTNRHAPITIIDCGGPLAVTNEYSPIELTACEGDGSVRNTGQITISNHTGDLVVDNSNGPVRIDRSEGNFRVYNSFGLVQVDGIEGSVTLGNSHAPIIISDITGRVRADNASAPLQLSYFTGPIELSNSNGPIMVEFSSDATGASTIKSTGSVVNISLEPEMDLLLRATAVGGDIQSAFPLRVSTSGATKTGELSLGRAKSSLTVTGTGSQILVSEGK